MTSSLETPNSLNSVSPYDNIDHPDHPNYNNEANTKLYNVILKGTPVLTGAIVACGCAYVGLNDPESKQLFPTCGFYALTGMYCPGCGMTRALHSLLGGNIIRAIRFNLLLVLAMPILIYAYVWWMSWTFKVKEMPKLKFSRRVAWSLFAFALIFIIGRNFPGDLPNYFSLGK